jgi:hypothetical protein
VVRVDTLLRLLGSSRTSPNDTLTLSICGVSTSLYKLVMVLLACWPSHSNGLVLVCAQFLQERVLLAVVVTHIEGVATSLGLEDS